MYLALDQMAFISLFPEGRQSQISAGMNIPGDRNPGGFEKME
jgi:hypothetical protein